MSVFTAIRVFLLLLPLTLAAQSYNGFDLSQAIVPTDNLVASGVPRDGIPALDEPEFIKPAKARFLRDRDRVLGISLGGEQRAYPLEILNHHEVVNDTIAGRAVVVTYCPLCATGIAFDVTGQPWQTFGVSGLLYNSDVLLYDRQTGSLWSQMLAKAISGPAAGYKLHAIPVTHTRWRQWRERHPDTLVLSTDTGFDRNYRDNPYETYAETKDIWFPVAHRDKRLNSKARVIGLEINGQFKAYPFSALPRRTGLVADEFAGQQLTIEYDRNAESGRVLDENGNEIVTYTAYWFAWVAFHPGTAIYE